MKDFVKKYDTDKVLGDEVSYADLENFIESIQNEKS